VILLHRLTPFALAGVLAAGFAILILAPKSLVLAAFLLFFIAPLLLARLLLWEVKRGAFWVFLGVPMFMVASSVFFFLFLESDAGKWLLALSVIASVGLYAENLFTFYHLPGAYQAYSLEYLSLVIAIASGFFFTAGANGAHLFLRDIVPLWIPSIIVFIASFLSTLAMFWVSKVGFETGRRYALGGAILMTELFVVLSFLPTSFVTNAAAYAVFFYVYLGLMRANVLEKLSKKVVRRYLLTASVLLVFIFVSAQWL
jgi:hypothetical protein